MRPPELASDTATSESALLHALERLDDVDPSVLVFLQCTSPFTSADDISAVVEPVLAGRADCSFAGQSLDSQFATGARHWLSNGGSSCGP
jgi:N-acylneuraminate cytidylyltransferase